MTVERVLVYRLGSLGDTVVALPCLHLIRRIFPAADVRVLTNLPVVESAPRLSSVLEGSGLIQGSFEYPVSLRDGRQLWSLMRQLRRWNPQLVIYLVPRGRFRDVLRDAAFLWAAGVARIVGLPWKRDLRQVRVGPDGICEREAERLARCVAALGDARPRDPAHWSLNLTREERTAARQAIAAQIGDHPYIVLSPGTKQPVKAWGTANWRSLADGLAKSFPHKIVFLGAREDEESVSQIMTGGHERYVNMCGALPVRLSAAAIADSRLFIGADSGPMHLAAAVGTPLIAIFSRLSPPGVWFPFGERVRLFYPYGEDATIMSISPAQVLAAVESLLKQAET